MVFLFAIFVVALLPHGLAVRSLHHLPDPASLLAAFRQSGVYTPEEYAKMIADFSADWERHGVEVEVFDSIDDLLKNSSAPWRGPADKAVSPTSSTDAPRCFEGHCQAVRIDAVVPYLSEAPYLYHGGDIKTEHFGDGINFGKASDQITGPAFFTSHNLFMTLYYGANGIVSWGNWEGSEDPTTYRLALEIEIQHRTRCWGIVPDWSFLNETATKFNASLEEALREPCGTTPCSFVALNWNRDGKEGSGYIPYEFRMLPGSVETCGLKFRKVIMVKSTMYDRFFNEFEFSPAFRGARKAFGELLRWNQRARAANEQRPADR